MDCCIVKLFISTIIFMIITRNVLSQCIKSTPCTCIREDEMGYNLTSLTNQKFTTGNYNITFQPCKNANLTFEMSNFSESECNSSSICMLNSNNVSINLGRIEDSAWNLPSDKDEVSIVYRHTSDKKITYETKIILICCHSCVTSNLRLDTSNNTKYNLLFLSRNNCLIDLRPKGLSTGSVIVIIFCVFSSLYLIGGAVALKVFRGAIGLELIPNYDFWSTLPGLVRDGVTFTLSGCTALSYEQI